MTKEGRHIKDLFGRLTRGQLYDFPKHGYTESVGAPRRQGVYVIYSPKGTVLHVGRTQRGRKGLRQRLNNHLLGQSSFIEKYLKGRGSRLRNRYKFRYLAIKNPRERALVESLAIGKLCPNHLGLGNGPTETGQPIARNALKKSLH